MIGGFVVKGEDYGERGLVYEDAHELANLKYNWWKAFLKEE